MIFLIYYHSGYFYVTNLKCTLTQTEEHSSVLANTATTDIVPLSAAHNDKIHKQREKPRAVLCTDFPFSTFPFISFCFFHFQSVSGATAKFFSESSVFHSSPTLLQILTRTAVICSCVKAKLLLASFTI